MSRTYNDLSINDLSKLFGAAPTDNFSEDFLMARVRYDGANDYLKFPCRLNAYCAFFCIKGSFLVDINVTTYKVTENTMIVYTPGNIVKLHISGQHDLDDLDFIIVAVSGEFLQGIRLDISSLFDESINVLNSPCITIGEVERKILYDYYLLASDLYLLDNAGVKEAMRSIVTSLFSIVGGMRKNEIDTKYGERHPGQDHAKYLFNQFMMLVTKYYHTEKEVGFYADKLCITPKYLSRLVKEVSGKSAPQWINSFITLEAKNLLKYSEMSGKEIAARLNFAGVPSFYKFFKAQTGMTPGEYKSI